MQGHAHAVRRGTMHGIFALFATLYLERGVQVDVVTAPALRVHRSHQDGFRASRLDNLLKQPYARRVYAVVIRDQDVFG